MAALQAPAAARGRQLSFSPIVTVRGEVLHNEDYSNVLEVGKLLLVDSGAESPLGYAGDITRTFPVTGRFAPEQRDIYEVVLAAQLARDRGGLAGDEQPRRPPGGRTDDRLGPA